MLPNQEISAPKQAVSAVSAQDAHSDVQQEAQSNLKLILPQNMEADPQQRLMICESMIDLSAAYFNICSKQLRRAGRCVQAVSRVRQIAMYVSHTGLGLTMTDVGKGFCRDRTTVMHACHQIEDLRDDEEFDAIVEKFNKIAHAAFSNILGANHHG